MAATPGHSMDMLQGDTHAFALRQSDCIYNSVLAAGVAESVTAPVGARYVVFSATGDFWCRIGAAADAPAADVADGSGSELNPAVRILPSDAVAIGLEADAACKVSLMFYRL